VKVTIAFENCNCEVTGEYYPAELEDGFMFTGADFFVEDFVFNGRMFETMEGEL